MRNSKQETIAGIVSEMLEFTETDSQTIGRDVLRRRIQNFARRFEAAAKREALVCDLLSFADRIEVAHQREVEELRKGISELLDALQEIYDEECTSYGTGEVYDKWSKALKGVGND